MTAIEWTHRPGTKGETWNPVAGCSIVSPGCTNCYAMKMAARIEKMAEGQAAKGRPSADADAPSGASGASRDSVRTKPTSHYAGTTMATKAGAVWTGRIAAAPDHILTAPLRWKRPRTVFVNSMSDLFHEDVPDALIDRVFAVIALTPQHTYQILTKRPQRMRRYLSNIHEDTDLFERIADCGARMMENADAWHDRLLGIDWPLPNVWLGVSAERQQEADKRIPHLLATPAAVRFVSAEPLLGPISFRRLHPAGYDLEFTLDALTGGWSYTELIQRFNEASAGLDIPALPRRSSGLDWIIVGGESGPGARPMHPAWARSIRDQCARAGTAFFFKQWGTWSIAERAKERSPFWRFPDGEEFHIMSDGEDIIMAEAEDSTTPRHIWGPYWADGHGHLAKKPGKARAGRLLDGREHNDWPEAAQ